VELCMMECSGSVGIPEHMETLFDDLRYGNRKK